MNVSVQFVLLFPLKMVMVQANVKQKTPMSWLLSLWENFAFWNSSTVACSHQRDYLCTILVVCTVHAFLRSDDAISFVPNYSLDGVENCILLDLSASPLSLHSAWASRRIRLGSLNKIISYSDLRFDIPQEKHFSVPHSIQASYPIGYSKWWLFLHG
jgi:hypothetical protein